MPGKLGAPPWIPLWRLNFLIPCKKENHGAKRQAFKIIINVGLVADMKSISQAEISLCVIIFVTQNNTLALYALLYQRIFCIDVWHTVNLDSLKL